jgi:uncharacterized protein with GYD domain
MSVERIAMPKYMFKASYTEKGLQDILSEGGSKRFEVMGNAIMKLGGKVEEFYFALGETDLYLIVDLPDRVSASAFSIVTNASESVKVKTVVLLTPEELDQAMAIAKKK